MNKQKTVDNFSGSLEGEKLEEDCVVVPGKAGAYQGELLANVEDAQVNRGKEERDADGLAAEIFEARSGWRSQVNDW